MSPDDQLSQCYFHDETTNIENNPSKDEEVAQLMTTSVIYKAKLLDYCGIWEDYPNRRYRMEFHIEMGELIGYSNICGSKAFANYDGKLLNMIIIHSKVHRPLDRYRGRLGWNRTYIVWEKEDSSCERGWHSTRRWIKTK
jgi:hypothetical protein